MPHKGHQAVPADKRFVAIELDEYGNETEIYEPPNPRPARNAFLGAGNATAKKNAK